MEITMFKRDGKWLLVRGVRMRQPNPTASAVKSRWVFNGCWTGDRWVRPKSMGMMFPTHEEAEAYLEQHRAVMEGDHG